MAYVAPIWKNGAAPALDAAALQAISDAIVANQTKNTQQDSSISSLQTAVNGKSRVATGSYIGTGTYGASNPNSITFPFTPKLAIMLGYVESSSFHPFNFGNRDYNILFSSVVSTSYTTLRPFSYYLESGNSGKFTDSNKIVYSWYSNRSAKEQCNYSGYTYHWIAFG